MPFAEPRVGFYAIPGGSRLVPSWSCGEQRNNKAETWENDKRRRILGTCFVRSFHARFRGSLLNILLHFIGQALSFSFFCTAEVRQGFMPGCKVIVPPSTSAVFRLGGSSCYFKSVSSTGLRLWIFLERSSGFFIAPQAGANLLFFDNSLTFRFLNALQPLRLKGSAEMRRHKTAT